MKNETIKNILITNREYIKYLIRKLIKEERFCCGYFFYNKSNNEIQMQTTKQYNAQLNRDENFIYLFKIDNFSIWDLAVTEDDIVNDIIANYDYEVISTFTEFAKKHNQLVKAESEYIESDEDDDDDDENEYGKKIDKLKCELMTYYNQMRLSGIIMKCQDLHDKVMQLIMCMQNHELYI